MEEQGIKVEDALLAIEIFKKALEHRPFIKKAILGQDFQALSTEERLNEVLTRRIALHYADDEGKIPCLFFRFVGDESPIVEAVFYPFEAVLAFLAEARSYAQWTSLPDQTDEDKEKRAVQYAIDLTLIMIDNFYRRGELMMNSFTSEVIAQWRIENRQKLIQYQAERGDKIELFKDPTLEKLLKDYTNEVLQLWKYQGQTLENFRKFRLAEEYDAIYKHWKLISKVAGEDFDWRIYAKAQKFQDTPDDLLDKLENTDRVDKKAVENRISELALEHAARRVGLIKKRGVSESIIGLRKKGVRASGYTSAQLFSFLKEGRVLRERWKANQEALAQGETPKSLELDGQSAQAEKVKAFEQRLKFIKGKSEETVEQNRDSAQEEKS